jgi:heat shock protein HslJ
MRRLALLFAPLLLSACGSDSMVGPSDILATTWRLQSIEQTGAGVVMVATPDRYTLRLGADGQAGVRADCNSCGGRYTLNGDALDLSPLACTLIACADDSLDGPFLTILGSGARVRVDGDALFVSSAKGTLRFTR